MNIEVFRISGEPLPLVFVDMNLQEQYMSNRAFMHFDVKITAPVRCMWNEKVSIRISIYKTISNILLY